MNRKMKDSGVAWIGEVPEGWTVERLQWHAYEINVKNNPVITDNILSLTNDRGVIPYEEKGNQGNKSKETVTDYKVAFEDTIIANSMNILIGSVGLSKYKGCVSPVYYVFKNLPNTDLHFLNYLFQMRQFQRELRKYANGILEIRLRVSSSDILKRMVAFPSLEEQSKIAAYLDRECGKIDALVAKTEQQIAALEEYKKSVIFSEINRTGRCFAKRKVKHVAVIGNGSDPVTEGDVPVYGSGGSFFRTCGEFKEGPTVLLGRKGTVDVPQYLEGRYWNVDTAFDVKMLGDNNLKWFYYCSQCFDFKYFLAQTTLPSMTMFDYYNISINVPDVKIQNEIALRLDAFCLKIDAIILRSKKLIATILDYKKSLIFECVTGKREVA